MTWFGDELELRVTLAMAIVRTARAGSAIEDYCRACKSDRMHTVIAADSEGRPLRVTAATVAASTTFGVGREQRRLVLRSECPRACSGLRLRRQPRRAGRGTDLPIRSPLSASEKGRLQPSCCPRIPVPTLNYCCAESSGRKPASQPSPRRKNGAEARSSFVQARRIFRRRPFRSRRSSTRS